MTFTPYGSLFFLKKYMYVLGTFMLFFESVKFSFVIIIINAFLFLKMSDMERKSHTEEIEEFKRDLQAACERVNYCFFFNFNFSILLAYYFKK